MRGDVLAEKLFSIAVGASMRQPRGNLPAETTNFVGRRKEIKEARHLLRRHRLLTLTGGAGIGKTRLALRIAARMANTFSGGAYLAELASLKDHTFLAQTVADILDIRDQSARPRHVVLAEFLADKELLLVMDNCEHVVDACAELVNHLLAEAPRLRILATSREALRACGEYLLDVPPLPLPGPARPIISLQNESTRLFAERATLALPGFKVDVRNHDIVAQLCRRLEGVPLAIELAAVRVRGLSLEQMLTRLENHYFEFLAEGSRVSVPRTQTLRAAIDWSFSLCSAREQTLWARVSVFVGTFDLDAAEHICSGDGIAGEDVLELLAGLVEKSIVVRADQDRSDVVRYRMLEAIRQYGLRELVASDVEAAVRARHWEYYARLADRVAQEWLGSGELGWFTRLWRDHANLRVALEFCLASPGRARTVLEVGGCLWLYWTVSGYHKEARHWLDQALSLDQEPTRVRARALWVGGWLALLQADWAEAQWMLEECRVLATRLGDRSALAHHARTLATAAFFDGDSARSLALFEDAVTDMRAAGDSSGLWMTLLQLMVPNGCLGRVEGVRACGRQCLSMVASEGAPMARSWSLWAQGLGMWLVGGRVEAGRLVREALCVGPLSIDRWGTAHCLEILAWAAAAGHDCARAARLFGAARTVWRSTGTPPAELNHLAREHKLGKQRAHDELGDNAFAAAFDEGTRFTYEQAISYALRDRRSSPAETR